jgi:hypothetical protein
LTNSVHNGTGSGLSFIRPAQARNGPLLGRAKSITEFTEPLAQLQSTSDPEIGRAALVVRQRWARERSTPISEVGDSATGCRPTIPAIRTSQWTVDYSHSKWGKA